MFLKYSHHFRVLESDNAIFELEHFYTDNVTPKLNDITIVADVDACLVTNDVNGSFTMGTNKILVGLRTGQDMNFTIIGTIDGNQKVNHPFTVPAIQTSVGSVSLSNDYLERLWAYLQVRKVLENQPMRNRIQVVVASNVTGNCTKDPLKSYGFVTDFTPLVVTEGMEDDPKYKLELPPEIKPLPPVIKRTFVPKSFRAPTRGDASSCQGTLTVFTQTYLRGLDFQLEEDYDDLDFKMEGLSARVTSFTITGKLYA